MFTGTELDVLDEDSCRRNDNWSNWSTFIFKCIYKYIINLVLVELKVL
jgi:hypothetical protein